MVYEKPEAVPIMLRNPDPDVVDQLRREHAAGIRASWSRMFASALGCGAMLFSAANLWLEGNEFAAGVVLIGAILLVILGAREIYGSPGLNGLYHRNDPTMCWVHLYDRIPPGPYELPPGHDL